MRRAFTLIELLVVIAIIAILAAILFPVFAQAKEAAKKAQGISNMKQAATGIVLYSTDYDDGAPSQGSIADGGACGAGAFGEVLNPWDWIVTTPAGGDDVNCTPVDGQAWVNSTQPYVKNWQLLEQPTFNKRDTYTAAYMATIRNPQTSALTFNGLLHHYQLSAVGRPSNIPLLWAGAFKNNWRGGSYASAPVLTCTGSGGASPRPCRFNPSGNSVTGAVELQPYAFYSFNDATLNNMWHYSRGTVFAYTDTSAKFVPVTGPSRLQPWLNINQANGNLVNGQHTICGTVGNVVYPALFRPDNNGDNYATTWTINACNF